MHLLHARKHARTRSIFFFHPLIPNCLRKQRGEIPLQCLGSAVFGNRPLSHTMVGGLATFLSRGSRTHVHAVASSEGLGLRLSKHPGMLGTAFRRLRAPGVRAEGAAIREASQPDVP